MKGKLLCLISALSLTMMVHAASVDADVVRTVVENWIEAKGPMTRDAKFDVDDIESIIQYPRQELNDSMFVVQFKDNGGFIVTSDRTDKTPILTYSATGTFEATTNSPLYSFLTSRAVNPRYPAEEKKPLLGASKPDNTDKGWDGLLQEKSVVTRAITFMTTLLGAGSEETEDTGAVVEPLTKTKWSQTTAQYVNYYNTMTPNYSPAGCVCVAMAQLMRYHEYPKRYPTLGYTLKNGRYVTDPDSNCPLYFTGIYQIDGVDNNWAVGVNPSSEEDHPMTDDETISGHKVYYPGWTYVDVLTGDTKPAEWDRYKSLIHWEKMLYAPGDPINDKNSIEFRESMYYTGKLMMHLGLSLFNVYRGGTASACGIIKRRLNDTFGYACAHHKCGYGNKPLTFKEKKNAICASLDAGLPCVLGISSHAVVTDGYGYDSAGRIYIHLSMGWGGSGDAWYLIDDAEYGYVSESTASNEEREWPTDTASEEYTPIFNVIYNIYPEGDRGCTIVSGRAFRNEAPLTNTVVEALDLTNGKKWTANTNIKGIYTLKLLPGAHYTITVKDNDTSETLSKDLFVMSCISSTKNDNFFIRNDGYVGNVHGFDFAFGTDSNYSVTNTTRLTHRWSFNEDYKDEITGNIPTKVGSNISLTSGHLELTGSAHGSGHLDLGTGLVNKSRGTIEIWGRNNTVRNWSRIFDLAESTTNYIMASWTYGTNTSRDRIEIRRLTTDSEGNEVTEAIDYDDMLGPHSIGDWFYFVITFEDRLGNTFIRFQKYNVATAALMSEVIADLPYSAAIDKFKFLLGGSIYSSDRDATASYDEVRIWDGVLSDRDIISHLNSGPDLVNTTDDGSYDLINDTIPETRDVFEYELRVKQYGTNRVAMINNNWPTLPLNQYDYETYKVSPWQELIKTPIAEKSQLRFDAWIRIPTSRSGVWRFHQKHDDYFSLVIDGKAIIQNNSYTTDTWTSRNMYPGWHKLEIVCGDTYGGYGPGLRFMSSVYDDVQTSAGASLGVVIPALANEQDAERILEFSKFNPDMSLENCGIIIRVL